MSANSNTQHQTVSLESNGQGDASSLGEGEDSLALVDFLSYLANWEDGYSWGIPEVASAKSEVSQLRWHSGYGNSSSKSREIVFIASETQFGSAEEALFSSLLEKGLQISPESVGVALSSSTGVLSEKTLLEIQGETEAGRVVIFGDLITTRKGSGVISTLPLTSVVADASMKRILWEQIKHLRALGS